jgi:hypothetical protein
MRHRLVALLLLIMALPLRAQGQSTQPSVIDAGQDTTFKATTFGARLSDFTHQTASGFVYGITQPTRWTKKTALEIVGAAAAVALTSTTDADSRDYIQNHLSKPLNRITSVIEPFGAQASIAVVGAFGIAGLVFNSDKARSIAAESVASSVIAGGIITPTLKYLVGRARPREGQPPYTFHAFSGEASFPSGHTTQAFAVASVIATESTSHTTKVVVYSIATGVGLSRMYHNAHYLSDVAAGAFIGTTVGRVVAHHGINARLRVMPAVGADGGAGVTFQLRSGS